MATSLFFQTQGYVESGMMVCERTVGNEKERATARCFSLTGGDTVTNLRLLGTLLVLMIAQPASPQSRTVFAGIPSLKISEGGLDRVIEDLPRTKAVNLGCVVSEIGGRFYWASRENKELRAHEGGAFVTFVATDGSGYVRAIMPGHKQAASLMSPTEERFDYVEHLLTGLGSVTYYGTAK